MAAQWPLADFFSLVLFIFFKFPAKKEIIYIYKAGRLLPVPCISIGLAANHGTGGRIRPHSGQAGKFALGAGAVVGAAFCQECEEGEIALSSASQSPKGRQSFADTSAKYAGSKPKQAGAAGTTAPRRAPADGEWGRHGSGWSKRRNVLSLHHSSSFFPLAST